MTVAILICAAALSVGSLRAGPVELCNWFAPIDIDVNIYNITIAGNVINQLNLNATATDPNLDPFVKIGGTANVTANLDANGNTVVTFKGSKDITPSDGPLFKYGPHSNNEPHIGLAPSPSGGAALPIIAHSFSNSNTGQSSALPAPLLFSVPPPPNGAKDIDYFIFFAQTTNSGLTTGAWFEEPLDGSKKPSLTLTNYSKDDVTLSDVGYFISETPIPIGDLNFGLTPPPGFPGAPFHLLPFLDGQTLSGGDGIGGPGGSTGPLNVPDLGAVPEPSSLTLLLTGALGFFGYGWRRRMRAA